MSAHAQPTPEQLTALLDYAAANGRTWKAQLRAAWMAGGYDSKTGEYIPGPLQQLRNSHGPSWLVKVTLIDVRIALDVAKAKEPKPERLDRTTPEAQAKLIGAYRYERDKIMSDPAPEGILPLGTDLYKLYHRVEAYLFLRNQVLNADLSTPTGQMEPNRALWCQLWNDAMSGLRM